MHAALSNYNFTRRDSSLSIHGEVVFIQRILEDPNFEVLWVHRRTRRLPRGYSCVVTATVYHPPSSNDNDMAEYLSRCLMLLVVGLPLLVTLSIWTSNSNSLSTLDLVGFPDDFDSNADTAITTTASVYDKLCSLNPAKAPGPDGIYNWILNWEYAEVQKLPFSWKLANISSIPKEKPARDINKHLRPISLARPCCLSLNL